MTLRRSVLALVAHVVEDARSRTALHAAARVGVNTRVFGRPRVQCEGQLFVGRNVTFVAAPDPIEITVGPNARLTFGDGAVVESGATFRVVNEVNIGRDVRVGARCIVDDDGPTGAGVRVEDDAWLDDEVRLLDGARVAPGSVIARGTVLGAHVTTFAPRPATSELERRLRRVVGRIVPSTASADLGTELRTLEGWDSLAALRVLIALEEEFSTTLPADLFGPQASLSVVLPFVSAESVRPGAA